MSQHFDDFLSKGTALQDQNSNEYRVPLVIPVDLQREEFIKFNSIVSKQSGKTRLNPGYLVFVAISVFLTVMLIISDLRSTGTVDFVIVFMFLLVLLSAAISFYGAPSHIKREAGRSYDETMMEGKNFYGRVFVFDDRVEKHSDRNETVLKFSDDIKYYETKDMMIFISAGKPAIVIPARCLGLKNLQGIRKIALPNIPAYNQSLKATLEPALIDEIQQPLPLEKLEDLPSVLVHISYTLQEIQELARQQSIEKFSSRVVLYGIISIIVSLVVIALTNSFLSGVVMFCLIVGLFFIVPLLIAHINADSRFEAMEDAGGLLIRFTSQGLTVRTPERKTPRYVPWNIVNRVLNKKNWEDFYLPDYILRIPKRCMNDTVFNEIKRLVGQYQNQN